MDTRIAADERTQPPRSSRLVFESVASHSPKYRSDIDGLRAIAVISVVLYHLKIAGFQSGFMGVDVFYVISGYLITSLISKELSQGHFSIVTFYERRTRRIFPALFTVLFFCTFASFLFLYPEQLTKYGKSLLATTFFVSNLYFWHSALPSGYFDAGVSAQPLLHTWSLAVEEQFYLLFPVTLYLLFRYARKRINAFLLFVCCASFAFNLWTTQHRPVVAFYWIMPRAWELLIGALLATKAFPSLGERRLREAIAPLGLGLIFVAVCLPHNGFAFPGYVALLPCVGTSLVIYAGDAGPSVVSRILSVKPLVFVGVISYSLYLWHWPLIVFTSHFPLNLNGNVQICWVLTLSVLAAFLSFEYIERPFRGRASPFSRRQVFAFGAAASVLAVSLSLIAYRTHGLPSRYDSQTRQIVLTNQMRLKEFVGTCENWKSEVRYMSDIQFCEVGPNSDHKVLFWGDSHVEQLYPLIQNVFSGGLEHHSAITAFSPACLPDQRLNNRSEGYHCDSFAKYVLLRAQRQDIETVFVGFSTWWWNWKDAPFCLATEGKCTEALSTRKLHDEFFADLSEEIHVLRRSGKRVIVCLPFPFYGQNIPELEMSNAIFGGLGLSKIPKETDSLEVHDEIKSLAQAAGAETLDPREVLCSHGHCMTDLSGISIYSDSNHLATSQVHILEDKFRQVLQHAAPPPVNAATSTMPSLRSGRPQAVGSSQPANKSLSTSRPPFTVLNTR